MRSCFLLWTSRRTLRRVDEAAAEGVKIVSIDSEVTQQRGRSYIGTDNYEAGCWLERRSLTARTPCSISGS